MIDVSLIVTFHNEKILAHQTLSSIARARKYAYDHGISSELVAVLDRADKETAAIVRHHPDFLNQGRALEVDNGDAATSRNEGIRAATGNIVCIADGDDYYSENWIERSVHGLKAYGHQAIIHPEIVVTFGDSNFYHRQIDQKDPDFNAAGLLSHNYWVAWASSWKDTFERIPYQRTAPAQTGFGYEDWHWNCETIASGYVHHLAEQTVGFYRRKKQGVLASDNQSSAIIKPTALFEPLKARSFLRGRRS